MRETAVLMAVLYVLVYLLAQAWGRRSPARVVVICPLRGGAVPQEILERLDAPTRVSDLDHFACAEFTIGYLSEAPGISLASVNDEASLDEKIGPYLYHAIFAPNRDWWLACFRDQKWNAAMLYGLALEVLHHVWPRSLLVDFRTPPVDLARVRRISTTETDLDLGMYAYEILCRLRRYSRYHDATFQLLFCDGEGAWLFTG